MYRFAHRRYRLPFRQPVRTAYGPWVEREGFLIRLEDENGRAGFGDIAPIPWFGTETLEDAEAACTALGDRIDERTISALPEKCLCVRAALLAAARRPGAEEIVNKKALPVAVLLPAGRGALELIAPKAEAGFRTFKWKVGVGDLADELALLDDLVAELPDGGKLRLDANGAWDRRKAEKCLERCADRPVEFLEQPVAPDAKGVDDLLLGLARDFPTPLALDESVVSAGDVARWLERGWPGVFVIKPVLLGDVGAVVAKLEKAKARVVFSSALETKVGAKAAIHSAFAFDGEARALGFGVWPLFMDGRFDGPHLAPFIRPQDVAAIDEEAAWDALS